jgi:hypothetical protein
MGTSQIAFPGRLLHTIFLQADPNNCRSPMYFRYSPNFIPGSGQVDGEILETLWSSLNEISASARGMSTQHRREVLDHHMNDSNWKKLLGMGT